VTQESDSLSSGLGLANIRRRLLLLYQEEHLLNIESGTDEFRVELQIP